MIKYSLQKVENDCLHILTNNDFMKLELRQLYGEGEYLLDRKSKKSLGNNNSNLAAGKIS